VWNKKEEEGKKMEIKGERKQHVEVRRHKGGRRWL
jgi:hypothetical protein